MTRTRVIAAVIMVALVMIMAAEAVERNGNVHCMTECYFDCMQIKIFNEGECKRECILACARNVMRKASHDQEEDDSQFFPLWV